jgi:hypothetical protein
MILNPTTMRFPGGMNRHWIPPDGGGLSHAEIVAAADFFQAGSVDDGGRCASEIVGSPS